MMAYLVDFVSYVIALVMTVLGVVAPLTGDKTEPIRRAKEGCEASFAVVSDTHLTEVFLRQSILELGMKDMAEAEDRLDAVVFDGDMTDHGAIEMWDRFAAAVTSHDEAEQRIMVVGNHDTWGPVDGDLELTKQTFIDYNKKICDRDITEMYYSTEINGCPVIVLGSEGDHTYATVSDTQIAWFADEMAKAAETGKPIFVFMHQSINGTHGLPYTWEMNEDDPPEEGGIGEASDDILNIIKQYKNVFYISGHIHAGFANDNNLLAKYTSVEKYDGYTLINVPCYTYPDVQRGGNITNGTGYVFEVYENEVLLRARNFATGTWCPRFDDVIELV